MWLEQLIAESTGKQGKGLIPVDREPLGDPGVGCGGDAADRQSARASQLVCTDGPSSKSGAATATTRPWSKATCSS